MNKVIEVGRLTEDITLRKTASGVSVCNFTLAVPRKTKGETDFIKFSAWSGLAEFLEKYVCKGCRIAISGRISTRSYKDKDDRTIHITEVVAEEADPIDWKSDKQKTDDELDGFVNDLDDLFGGE